MKKLNLFDSMPNYLISLEEFFAEETAELRACAFSDTGSKKPLSEGEYKGHAVFVHEYLGRCVRRSESIENQAIQFLSFSMNPSDRDQLLEAYKEHLNALSLSKQEEQSEPKQNRSQCDIGQPQQAASKQSNTDQQSELAGQQASPLQADTDLHPEPDQPCTAPQPCRCDFNRDLPHAVEAAAVQTGDVCRTLMNFVQESCIDGALSLSRPFMCVMQTSIKNVGLVAHYFKLAGFSTIIDDSNIMLTVVPKQGRMFKSESEAIAAVVEAGYTAESIAEFEWWKNNVRIPELKAQIIQELNKHLFSSNQDLSYIELQKIPTSTNVYEELQNTLQLKGYEVDCTDDFLLVGWFHD